MTSFTPPTSQSLPPGLAGVIGLPTVSQLYVDGMPIDAIAPNLPNTSSGNSTVNQFWATGEKFGSTTVEDIFQVTLSATERINLLSFQLARFPQTAVVEYWDQPSGSWIGFTQTNGLPATTTIFDSLPAVCWQSPISNSPYLHPQHFGTGHWVTYEMNMVPTATAQIRIRLTRPLNNPNAPQDPFGNYIPYSLGVKDFLCGYAVTSLTALPNLPASTTTPGQSQPIATSTDILGSPVQYVIRTNSAQALFNQTGVWRCEPQPVSNAVVNLYADTRTPDGNPQVFDRLYISPVGSGCTVNLYYSNDIVNQSDYPANNTPLGFPTVQAFGATVPTTDKSGITLTGNSYLTIDNTTVQFDQTQPFQIGMIFSTLFPSTDLGARTIYDDGNLTLTWGPSSLDPTVGAFSFNFDQTVTSVPMTFAYGAQIYFYLNWDQTTLTINMPGGNQINSVATQLINFEASEYLTFGATAEGTGEADVLLRSVIFKTGNPDDSTTIAEYFANPGTFVTTPEFPSSPSTTDNAILRYDPSQMTGNSSTTNPYGFVGGPSVVFENLNWTPIARDYQLKRGFYDFPAIKARYLNLEFSNLAAQPYETSTPVLANVNLFSDENSTVPSATGTSTQAQQTNTDVHQDVASLNRFTDQLNLQTNNSNSPYRNQTYLPTEVKYSPDPTTASLLNAKAPYWNFSQQNQSPSMPSFSVAGQHYYYNLQVPFDKRVAYFVGISDFQIFRTNITTDEDTDHWIELFHDDAYIQYPDPTNTWNFNASGNGITTPSQIVKPVVIESALLNSYRNIRGFQYATTQSPPAQLLPDPDFNDPSLQHWMPFGSNTIITSTDIYEDNSLQTVAQITLTNSANLWSIIESTFANWQAIEDSNPSPYLPRWEDLEESNEIAPLGGIQNSVPVTPSTIGRLYAAARVIAPSPLTSPLYMDIVNGDGTLLATGSQNIDSAKINEFYVEYAIQPIVLELGNTWAEMEAIGTWAQIEALGTWSEASEVTENIPIYDVTVRLYQEGGTPTTDVWYVDNLSLFNDAILWEFSRDGGRNFYPVYDIKNNPNGVFIFPTTDETVVGEGSQFMWRLTGDLPNQGVNAIQIRPWYDSLLFGTVPTRLNVTGGPNLSPYDHYPSVEDDPMFQVWSGAIPQDWYFIYRQLLASTLAPQPVLSEGYVSEDLVAGTNEGAPAAPTPGVLPESLVELE